MRNKKQLHTANKPNSRVRRKLTIDQNPPRVSNFFGNNLNSQTKGPPAPVKSKTERGKMKLEFRKNKNYFEVVFQIPNFKVFFKAISRNKYV